jgi:hypothetical protein
MSSNFLVSSLFAMTACVASACAAAQEPQVPSTNATEQGVPLRMAVTEVERLPTKSYLNVPGFHQRTAPGSRSLMCYYTALAIEREFSYWFVVYPAEGSNRVVLGFSNAADDSPEKLLGPDYVKALAVGSDMMPVKQMSALCGLTVKSGG